MPRHRLMTAARSLDLFSALAAASLARASRNSRPVCARMLLSAAGRQPPVAPAAIFN